MPLQHAVYKPIYFGKSAARPAEYNLEWCLQAYIRSSASRRTTCREAARPIRCCLSAANCNSWRRCHNATVGLLASNGPQAFNPAAWQSHRRFSRHTCFVTLLCCLPTCVRVRYVSSCSNLPSASLFFSQARRTHSRFNSSCQPWALERKARNMSKPTKRVASEVRTEQTSCDA